MKQGFFTTAFLLLLFASSCLAFAQGDVTIVAPSSDAAEGLDLKAVSELFKESENLEEFEKALNDPDVGVNNLDLDENGDVDYIRVMEEVADDTHVIILQAPLGENEFQDVATIEVEKSGDTGYNMQVRGNDVIYGANYYVAPTPVYIRTWPIITWMYRPVYRPYRSVYYFGYYPRWWRPYRPVTFNVYHNRTVRYTNRTTFTYTKTTRVHSVTKVKYRPHSSTLVKKRTTVPKKKPPKGKPATVKKGAKKSGKKPVTKGTKKPSKKKGVKKPGKKPVPKGTKKPHKKKGASKPKKKKRK